jgi:plastocyanin
MTDSTSTTITPPSEAADTGEPARGTHLATLGFLMAAAGPLLMLAATLLWGLDSEAGAFFAIPLALGLLGAWLIRRRRTVPRVVALVLAVGTAATAFWTVFGLVEPDSFFDFVPGFLVLPGVLLALAAGITSIRSARRGRTVSGGERRAVTAILGLAAALTIVSLVLTLTGRETVSDDEAAAADVRVELESFEFDHDEYAVGAGSTVLVTNSDPFAHTFTVEALDLDVDLGPGDEVLVTIPEAPGTYVLYCEPHTSDPDDPGEDDMAAVLEVG